MRARWRSGRQLQIEKTDGEMERYGRGNVRGKNVEDAGNDTKGIEPVIAPAMAFM